MIRNSLVPIVGLTGYAGSGKDYVADCMTEYFGTVGRFAFADGVREEAGERFPELDVWTKPYDDRTRKLLQWWGTEFRRTDDPDYWVRKTITKVRLVEVEPDVECIVITDVRFANEAQAVWDIGGLVVEVFASEVNRAKRLGGSLPPAHASEVLDFNADSLVLNNIHPLIDNEFRSYFGMPHNAQPFTPSGQ